MRQAGSTIKGYVYQFDKSIYEILVSDDEKKITLEGQIEDIDIVSSSEIETIQCKYHEKKDYALSNVIEPILEMYCHFTSKKIVGCNIKYVLYAYFQSNVEDISSDKVEQFLIDTENSDILVKYFPRIYNIDDTSIVDLANKERKNEEDKKKIKNYFLLNKKSLTYKIPINEFFKSFEYRKAEKHSDLKNKIIDLLSEIVDKDTALKLFYPNAFAKIAEISTFSELNKREITKKDLLDWLKEEKTLLINKWIFEIKDRREILKITKEYLDSIFSINSYVRTFVFSENFLQKNYVKFTQFIIDYIKKYYKKKELQKPPIFIFDEVNEELTNEIILKLFNYKIYVNDGKVGGFFTEDSFIYDNNCSNDFSLKITLLKNVNESILEKCNVNYLFHIGNESNIFRSEYFMSKLLAITTVAELKYLIGIQKKLEEDF